MVEKSSVVTRAVGRAGGKVVRFSGRAVGGITKRTGRLARKVGYIVTIRSTYIHTYREACCSNSV
jgi:hypothetical protein